MRRFGIALALAAILAACSSSDDAGTTTDDEATPSTTDSTGASATVTTSAPAATSGGATADDESVVSLPPFEPGPIEWEPFNEQVDVGLLDVPVDYAEPDGPQFELFLARYRAIDPDDRIGTLLVNPGGPGFGGTDYAAFASQVLDQELLRRFDVVGWDPRGTGESEPAIDCIDDYDRYFHEIDSTPETDAERDDLVAVAEEFAAACAEGNAAIIEHVGTNNAARDMDTIRRALGEETISYFGSSYGSELGAVWATLFPDTVRAAVFNGAADPGADSTEGALQQSAGFARSLDTFLAACSADDDCLFHNDGDAEGAFDTLMAELDADPLSTPGDRPPVNRDVATTGVQRALYSQTSWPALEQALAAARDRGDGTGLLALADSYYQRTPEGTYGNELEAFQAISCADTAERKTVDEVDAEAQRFTEIAPRLVPEGSAGGYFCTFFPPAVDPRIDIDTTGAGPIMVIGTTGDPSTPLESSERMVDALDDGRLVVVDAEQHTGYGVNRCVIDVVNDYLLDLVAPPTTTDC